jgi:hypothetical protein
MMMMTTTTTTTTTTTMTMMMMMMMMMTKWKTSTPYDTATRHIQNNWQINEETPKWIFVTTI